MNYHLSVLIIYYVYSNDSDIIITKIFFVVHIGAPNLSYIFSARVMIVMNNIDVYVWIS
jgi:hypothetical protein